jgi:hypothetical protein
VGRRTRGWGEVGEHGRKEGDVGTSELGGESGMETLNARQHRCSH